MVVVVVVDAQEHAHGVARLGGIDHRPGFVGPQPAAGRGDAQREAGQRRCADRRPPQAGTGVPLRPCAAARNRLMVKRPLSCGAGRRAPYERTRQQERRATVATLGLTEAERESIERFEARRHPAVDDGARHPRFLGRMVRRRASSCRRCSRRSPPIMPTKASSSPRSTSTRKACSRRNSASSRSRPSMRSTAASRSPTSPIIAAKAQLKKVLDQLLAQLKIEPEGATPAGRDRAADRDGRAGARRRRRARAR